MMSTTPEKAQLVFSDATENGTAGIGIRYRAQIGSVASLERRTGALMP
jgi:hypothetical protein